jgi:hypothetical protein
MDSLSAWLEVGGDWREFFTLLPWQTLFITRERRNAATTAAWQFAALSGAAQCGKLKPLEAYLSKGKLNTQQSGEEMLRNLDRFFNAHEKHEKARRK